MSALWKQIQLKVGVTADGVPGEQTERAVANALGLHSATGERRISARGIQSIKDHEGLRLTAYPDPASGGDPWTIGYGSTSGVKRGMVITQAQADARLSADVARFETAVNRLCPITTQGQFDALVSFAFNLGEQSLKESTLRRKHNDGDYAGAADEFARWRFASGKEMPGLVKRRAAEADIYRGAT